MNFDPFNGTLGYVVFLAVCVFVVVAGLLYRRYSPGGNGLSASTTVGVLGFTSGLGLCYGMLYLMPVLRPLPPISQVAEIAAPAPWQDEPDGARPVPIMAGDYLFPFRVKGWINGEPSVGIGRGGQVVVLDLWSEW